MPMYKMLVMSNAYPSAEKPYAGIFVKNQVEELKQRGLFDIELFSMQREFTGIVGSVLKYLRAAIRFIPKLMIRYDLLHLHFFFPLIWLAVMYKLLHRSTPVMLTLHGSDLHKRFSSPLLRKLHLYALNNVDYIQAVGHELAEELFITFGRTADLILPVGIDKRIFRPQYIDIEEKLYDFVFVGSFIDRKGVDLILEAMAIIDSTRIRYCFIGSGIREADIRLAAESHDICIMNNLSQVEIAIQLDNSRFFLFPSRYEPFGLVVTEALYCGIPCVVSRVGGLRSQIQEGINGIYIQSLDAQGVASAMEQALDLSIVDYKAMQKNAQRSNEDYSLENVVDKLEAVYGSMLEDSTVR